MLTAAEASIRALPRGGKGKRPAGGQQRDVPALADSDSADGSGGEGEGEGEGEGDGRRLQFLLFSATLPGWVKVRPAS